MSKIGAVVAMMLYFTADFCWAARELYDFWQMPENAVAEYLSDSDETYFNVLAFGAKGDGQTDDTKAFEAAWEGVCNATSDATMVVPTGSFLLKPITFLGPCNSRVTVQIEGTILAPTSKSAWNDHSSPWIQFGRVTGLRLQGRGTIDGQGEAWWSHSCKMDKSNPCKQAPTAMIIVECTDVVMQNLHFVNSPQFHLGISHSSGIKLNGLSIHAPEHSPNTDGIHIQTSRNVQITNCHIGTGDDCISISSGTSDTIIQQVVCGPGHGISIGSLGESNEEASVDGITVQGVIFNGTQNGARIKTWQGGSGYAKNIVFDGITLYDVQNPVVIDQFYCDSKNPCNNETSAVQIENVTFENIKGTTTNDVALKLACSETVACTGLILGNIDISSTYASEKSVCQNAFGIAHGRINPPSCLGIMTSN